MADTDSVGYTSATGGSRTTFATGWAAWEAAQDVIRQLKERAALLWDRCGLGGIGGGVFRSGDGAITFHELAARLGETGGPVVGRGAVNPKGVGGSFAVVLPTSRWTRKPARSRSCASPRCRTSAGHPPQLRRGTDAGRQRAGHRLGAQRRILHEPPGPMLNSSLLDYRMPTASICP